MRLYALLSVFVFALSHVSAQPELWFENATMRFDFYHCGGGGKDECYFFDEIIREPYWGGPVRYLVDTTMYGDQMFRIVDAASGELLYSRGYNTLFNEWLTTGEALSHARCMPESVVFPFPKIPVRIEIWRRDKAKRWQLGFSQDIDPQKGFVRKASADCDVFDVMVSGEPSRCVDIVLVPEGYAAGERGKFEQACVRFADELFSFPPYDGLRDKFNVRGVWAPSADSGVTLPGDDVWLDTAVGATFWTFGIERYQTVEDFQRVRDIAACAPYDCIYILSNTAKYGGGGIYNFYGISSANHPQSTGRVYVHEFGHLFAGLGDEYVGGVAYNDMYPAGVEPWEPNLTTLTDFGSKEWSRMLDASTPVPTPLSEGGARLLGVYEGGGYVARGVYRPWPNCLMNNLHRIEEFCPVCDAAIRSQIRRLCE